MDPSLRSSGSKGFRQAPEHPKNPSQQQQQTWGGASAWGPPPPAQQPWDSPWGAPHFGPSAVPGFPGAADSTPEDSSLHGSRSGGAGGVQAGADPLLSNYAPWGFHPPPPLPGFPYQSGPPGAPPQLSAFPSHPHQQQHHPAHRHPPPPPGGYFPPAPSHLPHPHAHPPQSAQHSAYPFYNQQPQKPEAPPATKEADVPTQPPVPAPAPAPQQQQQQQQQQPAPAPQGLIGKHSEVIMKSGKTFRGVLRGLDKAMKQVTLGEAREVAADGRPFPGQEIQESLSFHSSDIQDMRIIEAPLPEIPDLPAKTQEATGKTLPAAAGEKAVDDGGGLEETFGSQTSFLRPLSSDSLPGEKRIAAQQKTEAPSKEKQKGRDDEEESSEEEEEFDFAKRNAMFRRDQERQLAEGIQQLELSSTVAAGGDKDAEEEEKPRAIYDSSKSFFDLSSPSGPGESGKRSSFGERGQRRQRDLETFGSIVHQRSHFQQQRRGGGGGGGGGRQQRGFRQQRGQGGDGFWRASNQQRRRNPQQRNASVPWGRRGDGQPRHPESRKDDSASPEMDAAAKAFFDPPSKFQKTPSSGGGKRNSHNLQAGEWEVPKSSADVDTSNWGRTSAMTATSAAEEK